MKMRFISMDGHLEWLGCSWRSCSMWRKSVSSQVVKSISLRSYRWLSIFIVTLSSCLPQARKWKWENVGGDGYKQTMISAQIITTYISCLGEFYVHCIYLQLTRGLLLGRNSNSINLKTSWHASSEKHTCKII